ncbi:MAG: DNA polymerase I, partial [Calditrichaeota bacterium]|nr:DNA polymerase I [Calditrichota bacterium]
EVNFGVLYGMGEFGLAQRLGISRATARAFIEQYFSNFSRVREYIDELHTEAREKGYVETILGRRRPLPDLRSENFNIRSNAERIAINTPIQGSAADLIKIAMIRIDGALRTEGFRARMLLQVHDELLFEAPADELEPLSVRLRELMSGAMNLTVPLEVGISWGDDWLAAHE